jgi:hypothetical protein
MIYFRLQLFVCWNETLGNAADRLQTDHAAANETSLMMALHPNLVCIENLPQELSIWPTAIQGRDPRIFASQEAGQEILTKNLEWMASILQAVKARL